MHDASMDGITAVTDETLRAWPLPMPGDGADKEERGRILIIGGARSVIWRANWRRKSRC